MSRRLLLPAVALTALFLALAIVVARAHGPLGLDVRVASFVSEHRAGWATGFFRLVTHLGSTIVLIPIGLVAGVVLLIKRKKWRPLVLLIVAFGGASAAYSVVKILVDRGRPPMMYRVTQVSSSSFPSGHSTQAVAFWGMLAFVLGAKAGRRVRVAFWTIAGLVALLVGVSRVYLGAHWTSDVLGGWILGGAWLCLLVAVASVPDPRMAIGSFRSRISPLSEEAAGRSRSQGERSS